MHYEFPQDMTLPEVRAVITAHNARIGKTSFIEADRGDHAIFNYIVAFEDTFPHPSTGDADLDRQFAILRECRGLIFDKASGLVIGRRFQKFFNSGEKPETRVELLDLTRPHRILEKMDGSMITFGLADDGSLRAATKMGFTGVARPVDAFVQNHPKLSEFVRGMITCGYTPIFEWCSRKQRIVIDYPEDRLVLLAIRHNRSGHYTDYSQMAAEASAYGVEVVRALPGSIENITTFMAEARDVTGMEGYIVRFDDGHMVKVKGAEYCTMHRVKSDLATEKNVIEMIAGGKADDALPLLPESDAALLRVFADTVNAGLQQTAETVTRIVAEAKARGEDRKTFATQTVRQHPQKLHGVCFKAWEGNDPLDVLKAQVLNNVGTQTKVDEVRVLWGGAKWDWSGDVGE